MRIVEWVGLIGVLLVAPGCPVNLDTEDYPKRPLLVSDLVGEYRPTPQTLALIATEGKYPKRDMAIILNADRSLHMIHIPDWWVTRDNQPGGASLSGTGGWEVVAGQNGFAVELTLKESEQPEFRNISRVAKLFGKQPPYRISLTIGDPDSGRAMNFQKMSPAPSTSPTVSSE